MELRTTSLEGKLADVLYEKEYKSKWRMYAENPSMYASAALEITDKGKSYVLPFRGKIDDRPGIYPDGCVYFVKLPDETNRDQYLKENLQIVDFGDTNTVQDFLSKNAQIREMETNNLTDVDSVFTPPILSDDTAEMRAFKEAIAAKHMDINKYAPRFGDNFLNDKRILKTNSITMNKLVNIAQKMDIELELTIRDAKPDVANPIGKEISVILTRNGGDES